MIFILATIKRKVEYFITYPIVFLGRLLGKKINEFQDKRFIIFIRSADVGGSNKVTLDILALLPANQVLVISTKKAFNNGFLNRIKQSGYQYLDLSNELDNKWRYYENVFYRGVLSREINQLTDPIVIGGECIYFFKIIPYLKKEANNVEVTHLDSWKHYTQSFWQFISFKVCSTSGLAEVYANQIKANGIPRKYLERIITIDSWVDIPTTIEIHKREKLHILFVGRGAPQKRVHLLAKVVARAEKENRPFYFTLVGDVEKDISGENNYYTVIPNISNPDELDYQYCQADILILTSLYEGLPIVIMEMMSRGKVVLSTSVGSIPDYIQDGINGLLVESYHDEEKIITEMIDKLNWIHQNSIQQEKIGINAHEYAKKYFSKALFDEKFKQVLFGRKIEL